jgi:hypothetical protein
MEGVFQNEYDNSGEECERLEDQRVICRARADEETLDLKPQPRFNASQEEERDNPPLKYKNLAKKSKAGAIKNRKFDIEKEVFVDEKSLRAKKNNKAALIENVKKSTKSKGNGSKLKTKVVELK